MTGNQREEQSQELWRNIVCRFAFHVLCSLLFSTTQDHILKGGMDTSLQHHQLRRCSKNVYTGQFDENNPSVELPSSQMTTVCVELTELCSIQKGCIGQYKVLE